MTKIDQKWPKSPKIRFQWAHMMKIIVNYVWNKFGKILELFDHFLAIFFFSLKTHDFSEFFFENSKKALFDLWDLLWWVFHMFLALNHWFRPKNEGWKKSVPKMFKTAVTLVLKLKVNFMKNISVQREVIWSPYFFSLPSKYIVMYIRSENHKMVIVLCKILVLRPRSSK